MSESRRTPPHSVEAEEACIGAVLLDNAAADVVLQTVTAADFYRQAHRHIVEAITSLRASGTGIDLVTVVDHLRGRGLITEVGGAAYIAELADRVPTAMNARHYAGIVREHAKRRRFISLASDAVMEVYERGEALGDYMPERLSALLDAVTDERRNPTLSSLLCDVMASIEASSEGRGPGLVPTGLRDLDNLLGGGLVPGNLMLLGGRTSTGKSALKDSLILFALEQEIAVGTAEVEEGGKRSINRLLAKLAGVPVQRVLTGRLHPGEHGRLANAAEILERSPLIIRQGRDWPSIKIALRDMHQRGARVLFVDHLHHIELNGRDHPTQQLKRIVCEMADLAKALEVPLVVLAQINREAEREKDRRPQKHHLRECGEEVADDVLLLYRPAMYDKAADQELCEAIIAKQRNGPVGQTNLRFDPATARFRDWVDEPELFE